MLSIIVCSWNKVYTKLAEIFQKNLIIPKWYTFQRKREQFKTNLDSICLLNIIPLNF